MNNPGIPDLHHFCENGSGALVFPESDVHRLGRKAQQRDQLLQAILATMPKAQRDKIPAELLEGLSDGN